MVIEIVLALLLALIFFSIGWVSGFRMGVWNTVKKLKIGSMHIDIDGNH